jgi:hypothetical protein
MSGSSDSLWRGKRWDLPPLILHPLDRGLESTAVLDSIKLSLHLSGMAETDVEPERLLRGRYVEFRMLCLVGKDIMRWIAQCVDFAGRDELLAQAGLRPQSFADLLVNRTPPAVIARFESWGVSDFRRLVSRAVGLNAVFPSPPDYTVLSPRFLEEYYSYADSLYACYLSLGRTVPLDPASFAFSVYTSDEYLSTLKCGVDEEPS